jgi:hypothetical protein
MANEVYQLITGEHAGKRNGDCPCLQNAEIEGNPVNRIHSTEADVFAGLDSRFDKAGGNPVGLIVQLSIRPLGARLAEGWPIRKEERRCFQVPCKIQRNLSIIPLMLLRDLLQDLSPLGLSFF